MGKNVKKKSNKGFTLVEVLAVIVLISIITTFAFNAYSYVIKNSKDRAVVIGIDNIMSAAEVYSKESKDSDWGTFITDGTTYKFSCVTVQDLINNGYFGNDFVNKSVSDGNGITNDTYIKIIKNDTNKTIVSTETYDGTYVDECNNEASSDIEQSIGANPSDAYHVIYDHNGGAGRSTDTINKNASDKSITLPSSTREGYIFDGWYSSKEGGSKIGDVNSSFTPTYDVTLYAHWTRDPNFRRAYIRYDMNGGSLASIHGDNIGSSGSLITYKGSSNVTTIFYGHSLTTDGLSNWNNSNFINIKKVGHVVKTDSEWCKNANGTNCFSQNKVYSYSDFCTNADDDCVVTLYANWKPNKINIQYNLNGGSLASKHGTNIGTSGSLITNNGSTIVNTFDYGTVNNLANWDNSDFINIKRTGYTPKKNSEWCTNSNGTGTCFGQDDNKDVSEFCMDNDKGKTKDCTVTLYANWKLNEVKIKYNMNNGSLSEDKGSNIGSNGNYITVKDEKTNIVSDIVKTVKYGEKIGKSGLPNCQNKDYINIIRNGYSLVGGKELCTKADGTGSCFSQDNEEITATELCSKVSEGDCDLTLYVNWKLNKYTIKYDANGGSGAPSSQTKEYGKDLVLSSVKPTRSGYRFVHWNAKADGSSIAFGPGGTFVYNTDATLYAIWDQIPPTITFSPTSGSSNTGSLTVTVTCNAEGGIGLENGNPRFSISDRTGDYGRLVLNTTNQVKKAITLVSTGTRYIDATCVAKNDSAITVVATYNISPVPSSSGSPSSSNDYSSSSSSSQSKSCYCGKCNNYSWSVSSLGRMSSSKCSSSCNGTSGWGYRPSRPSSCYKSSGGGGTWYDIMR